MKTTKKKLEIEYTASEIRAVALCRLKSEYKADVWPQNNTTVTRHRSFIGRKGVADIIGYTLDGGVMVMCEVKTINDTLSQDQVNLLTSLHLSGGIALVAYQDELKIHVKPFLQAMDMFYRKRKTV